jgi:hypothetical protein
MEEASLKSDPGIESLTRAANLVESFNMTFKKKVQRMNAHRYLFAVIVLYALAANSGFAAQSAGPKGAAPTRASGKPALPPSGGQSSSSINGTAFRVGSTSISGTAVRPTASTLDGTTIRGKH